MTAIVSTERARVTYLTAAAGLLMLAVAVAMMCMAAPRLDQQLGASRAAGPVATRLTADLSHQTAFRSDSATTRACLAGPQGFRACAQAYTPATASGR